MHRTVNDIALPAAVLDVVGSVDVGLPLVVGYEEGVVKAVLVAQGGCPLSGTVGLTAVTQIIDIVVLEAVVDIVHDPPVHEVF